MLIKIKEPWWGAWKQFGWEKGTWGVGLKKLAVEQALKAGEVIDINVWKFKTTYHVQPQAVIDYANQHKTGHLAKGTLLLVVPSSLLETI